MGDEVSNTLNPKKPAARWNRIGILLVTFAIVVFVCAFGFGYYQLARMNIFLGKQLFQLQKQTQANAQQLSSTQTNLLALQGLVQKSEQAITQQAQTLHELRDGQKGNLDKWSVAEAQYLVKLANDHLQFSQEPALAIALLQRAQQILDKITDPALLEIRQSLAADLTNLQATHFTDTAELYLRLETINNQLDQLVLPETPLTQNKQVVKVDADLSWWRRGLGYTWQALKQIVLVKRIEGPDSALVLPDQKTFLYQNLHAQMETAIWAALHHHQVMYQHSLDQTMNWVKQYFIQSMPLTQTVLQDLQSMREIHVESPAINLSNTLQRFDQYFAEIGKTEVAQ